MSTTTLTTTTTTTSPTITLQVIKPIAVNAQEQMILVLRNNQKIGLITKFKPRAGETHPWKAFKLDGSSSNPNTMLGVFYGRGAKTKAINAIVG